MTGQALTQGAHHIGLAVHDAALLRDFFCDTLGFTSVGGVEDYPACFVSDGTILITLWQCADPANATPFDRRANIGLHHLALSVSDDAALDRVHEALAARDDVEIEFGPGPMGEKMPVRHLLAHVPGGIRVEFATPFPR